MPSMKIILLLVLLALPAGASDGVREINQTCALQTGCFPGDTAGFPVTISATGSYRLTSNLDRSAASVDTWAISISADGVTLDLGGFTVSGAAVCTGTPVSSCTNPGTGDGIAAFNRNDVTIRNGVVRGMPDDGIVITGANGVVERVSGVGNGGDGIAVASAGMIIASVGSSNLGDGLVSFSGTIQGSAARGNGSDGIDAGFSLVLGCRATDNGAFGLETSNTKTAYGDNMFACNNSAALCTEVAQVSNATAEELGTNFCGTDTICP